MNEAILGAQAFARFRALGVPDEDVERLRSTARLSVRLAPSLGAQPGGRSWWGGAPLRGAGVEWPRGREGEPLGFLAQVALSELQPAVLDACGLPRDGLVCAFTHPELAPFGCGPEERDLFHLEYWAPTEPLVECEPPSRGSPREALVARSMWTFDPDAVVAIAKRLRPEDWDFEWALREATTHGAWQGLNEESGLVVVGGHRDDEFDGSQDRRLDLLAAGHRPTGWHEEMDGLIAEHRVPRREWEQVLAFWETSIEAFPLGHGKLVIFVPRDRDQLEDLSEAVMLTITT